MICAHFFIQCAKSLLCTGRLVIKLTTFTASLSRFCRLVSIFFTKKKCVDVSSSPSYNSQQSACGCLTSWSSHSSLHLQYVLHCIVTGDAIAALSLKASRTGTVLLYGQLACKNAYFPWWIHLIRISRTTKTVPDSKRLLTRQSELQ